MTFGLVLYLIGWIAQILATYYATHLFLKSQLYRYSSGFFALGIGLLTVSSIISVTHILWGDYFDEAEAGLSAAVSISLLLGVIFFKKLLIDLESKNFILDQFLKKDALTSALSRVEAIARAEIEIKKSFRSQKSTAFLMLDIDHFKLINDSYGHPIGDQVLINLAHVCKEELREIDIFGRVGGEEFLIVLPETPKSEPIDVANRLRLAVAQRALATVGDKSIFITVSIGVAIFDPQADQYLESSAVIRKYYKLCDSAMYHAKQAGRNQVYCEPNCVSA
jgi:diguanylate cyclase (GGDEF)-like protein